MRRIRTLLVTAVAATIVMIAGGTAHAHPDHWIYTQNEPAELWYTAGRAMVDWRYNDDWGYWVPFFTVCDTMYDGNQVRIHVDGASGWEAGPWAPSGGCTTYRPTYYGEVFRVCAENVGCSYWHQVRW